MIVMLFRGALVGHEETLVHPITRLFERRQHH